ncbi:NADH oxidoreductase Hcr [Vibrio ichthyoenteri ATCC 700023]|uniref:NADH oxidoreductase Hcr n=1 Tax=Vibrio ichthyoenteri ATCC 700023 TaxID=870968 RepID=F9RYC3_9VIBR|nr:hybrid-cluster NAD(P)-dependent oxidoreductase [Vibrio ichthyoenteri]EGU46929.1 NADH oxidoreductase Hcr [Vibrio ichthyoenteri ATCC 700023]
MYFEWQGSQPVQLRCIDKYVETPDTMSIKLAPLESQLAAFDSIQFDFKPGQFITVGVEIEQKMEYRAYSLSSIAGESHLQLTIKRVEGGKVSNYLLDNLQVGDLLFALPPSGEFNSVDHPPKPINGNTKALLISAGCGITPVYAMAKQWLANGANVDVQFLHVAKSAQQTIYFDALESMAATEEQFTLSLLLKDASGTMHPQGRLNKEWLLQLVPDLIQRTVYLCGPQQFMQDTHDNLQALGFDMSNFVQESFTPISSANEFEPDDHAEDKTVSVSVEAFDKEMTVQQGAVLADTLEAAGLPLIVACRSGICGSCKCKVIAGSVRSTSLETLTAAEIEQGYVLACSSTVESDLAVQIG